MAMGAAEANHAEQQQQELNTHVETAAPETVDALLEAARYDDLDDIKSLVVSSGVSLDSKDSLGRTALHMAAANGHLEVVEYLISQGVAISVETSKRDDIHTRTTSLAGSYLRVMSHKWFWGAGVGVSNAADTSKGNAFDSEAMRKVLQNHDLNVCNQEKNTPLHWACLNGHIEVVKRLILAGASLSLLNSYERTPVDEALSKGKLDVINAINEAVAQLELAGVSVS